MQIIPGDMGKAVAEDASEESWENARDKLLDANTIKIDLESLDTGKNYFFRICTVNKAGQSKWVTVGPICCAEAIEEPRINIPRLYNKLITVPVGQKLHLNIPFQGRPKPTIKWEKIVMSKKAVVSEEPALKPDVPVETAPEVEPEAEPEVEPETAPEEEPFDIEEHFELVEEVIPVPDYVTIRNTVDSTVLFIRDVCREDTGTYRLHLTVGDNVVSADIKVAVVDLPTKVRKLTIEGHRGELYVQLNYNTNSFTF